MLKKLARSVREYKKQTLLTPLFMIGEVLCECIIPTFTAELINTIQAQGEFKSIVKYGLLLLGMAMLSLMFGAMAGKFAADASTGFAKNLRQDLFYRVQAFSFANIDRFSTASLVTRLTTDVTNVQMSFMMIIRTAVRAPLMLIIAAVMSANLGGRLAWVFAGFIPLLVIAVSIMTVFVMPLFKSVFKKYDDVNASVQENIKGIRVVKSFVREEYEKLKFGKASEMLRANFLKAERILAGAAPIMQIAMYGSMILLGYFCAKNVIGKGGTDLEVGTISGMLTYSMQILMSLMMATMIFVTVTMSIASAKRISEVLDEMPEIKAPENPVAVVPDGSVDFENVCFKYVKTAERNTLENIDLHIPSGATVGIIGGTGVGKTSLIQLISRLYDVTEGSVKVGGRDVREYDLATLRDNVAVVLQKNVLFSGTIKENMRWGKPDATDEEIAYYCSLAQASEFIEAFPDQYDTYIEQGGANVSGGQQQRLCIARALIKQPKILILDDSTSAVDTHTDALIRKTFQEKLPDTTKIIIAQRIASVQDADMIVVLENGRIDAVGNHETLLGRNVIYTEVYESQVKGGDFDEQ
ncbi:MAG: ABC transporter ATP-binding protein [Clostridia bacterium]|nr:ABC transporter ATP-binding protein [Clostridia bacterium]MBQ7688443.1 ABC transporter ATP-binding protein [Clostridia bacterium]